MYNYNNSEGGIAPFIRDLVIKLIFVIILVLLLIWLFPMPNMKPFYDRLFTENITLMKDTAKNYYTDERLPVKVNDKVTMSLGEMVDKHLILNLIDKKGNTCDTSKSYIEITRLETEYALKTYLSCGDEYDYIVEYIGCHNLPDVCEDCDKEVVVAPLTQPVTKTVTKPKTVINPKPEPKPEPKTEPKTPLTWVTYSKATEVDPGTWLDTRLEEKTTISNGITTTISDEKTQRIAEGTELDDKSTWVYAAMYIRESEITNYANTTVTFPGTRILDLDYLGVSDEAQDLSRSNLDLEVSNESFYTSSNYQNYINDRYEKLQLEEGCEGACSIDVTASKMKSASLTSSHFNITKNTVTYEDGEYILTTKVYIKANANELSKIDGYNDPDLGYEVIYIPVKFKVTWQDYETTYKNQYRYTTTVSYVDKEVLSTDIATINNLTANGYVYKSTRITTS